MSDDEAATLFGGKKFWIAQRVPCRSQWTELLGKHGGHLVKLDTQADILIADHARKEAPAGSLSWKFIEDSVKKGELQDPADYPAGPSIPSGQVIPSRPSGKLSRTPYTAEDDKQLWDWVTRAESKGANISGNKLYQALEEQNPRHTWQSWRDRWLKSLAHRERPIVTANHTSPRTSSVSRDSPPPPQNVGRRRAPASSSSRPNRTPAAAHLPPPTEAESTSNVASPNQEREITPSPHRQSLPDSVKKMRKRSKGNSFTDDDERILLSMHKQIEDLDPERMTEAWESFSQEYTQHSAEEWRNFWDEVVKPSQDRLKKIQRAKKSKDINPKLTEEESSPEPSSDVPEPTAAASQDGNETSSQDDNASSQDGNERILEELDSSECQKISEDLVAFLGAHDDPVHFNVNEKIEDDHVLLYDICRAVILAFDEEAEIQRPGRWEEVARLIGISQSPSKIAILKKKFSDVADRFFEFEEFILDLNMMQQETGGDAGDDDEIDEATYDDVPDSPIEQVEDNLGKRRRTQIEDNASQKSPDDTSALEDSVNETPKANKRQRIDKGKGKELEIPSTPEAFYKPQPKRDQEQNFAFDPETQDFHFPQATQDEESPNNYNREDSPSDQILHEAYRATQRSPEPDTESSERHRKAARRKIERYVALGYTEEIVREALAATTSNEQNVAIVMEALTHGKGIPDNIRGVWTAEDDAALSEAGGKKRMIKKHGSDHVEDRLIWLEAIEEMGKGD